MTGSLFSLVIYFYVAGLTTWSVGGVESESLLSPAFVRPLFVGSEGLFAVLAAVGALGTMTKVSVPVIWHNLSQIIVKS
jgi:hypothetical protein